MKDTRLIAENELIADFLGARKSRYTDEASYEMYAVIESIEDGLGEQHFFLAEEMPFSTDWNWLMEVVEAIDNILPDDNLVVISYNRCLIEYPNEGVTIEGLGNTRKEATYKAVVEFIIWYNENKEL